MPSSSLGCYSSNPTVGAVGPVVEVRAKCRTGEENFISCLRKSLQNHFQPNGQMVAMGGVFLIGTRPRSASRNLLILRLSTFACSWLSNEVDENLIIRSMISSNDRLDSIETTDSESGSAKFHVMPDFPPKPFACDAEVDDWLHFYDFR